MRIGQEAADIVVQSALIAFQRQHVVRPLPDHLCRDGALAVQRVGSDDAAFQRQQFQQLGHCGDLVGLLVHRQLAQQQPLSDRPGMQHVQRRLARRPIEGAPQGLGIDGHHALKRVGKPVHEAGEAGGERHGVKQPEHPAEGVVAGNAVLEAQKLTKERLLGQAEQRHVRPWVGDLGKVGDKIFHRAVSGWTPTLGIQTPPMP